MAIIDFSKPIKIGPKTKNAIKNAVDYGKRQIDRATEDDQTKLTQPNARDKAPNKKSSDPAVATNRVQFSSPYQRGGKPAALSVDSTWSKTDGEDTVPANTGKDGELPYSLFNRYALYNYRGFYGGYNKNLAEYYVDENNLSQYFRGKDFEIKNKDEEVVRRTLARGYDVRDVTEKKIIEYYIQNFPLIAYTIPDFLYNKYFQEIPVNHLITLRRFSMPVEDNIFYAIQDGSGESEKLVNSHVSTCTATTYFGEKTENKLEEILKFSAGLNWQDITADLQEIGGGSSTKDGGIFDKKNSKGNPTLLSHLGATMKGISASSLYRRQVMGDGDPLQKYGSFVKGPVNVINQTTTRNRGINFSNEFSLNFNYELKSWYKVNPKIAMLDLMSNMYVMTTNNGDFWGGGWRYNGGQSPSLITDQFGDRSLLRKGDFIGYAQSLVTDVLHGKTGPDGKKQSKGITDLFGDGSGGFSFQSIFKGVGELLQNILTQRIGSLMDTISGGQQNPGANVPNAIISGEPTGSWHVTIGNPLNPIAVMGNMICESGDFSLGGGLGYDDFPMEFNVAVKLKHGKPRDRSDIENMFNAGHGRIYAAPSDDLLNIAGKEVEEYGVLATGPGMHSNIAGVIQKRKLLNDSHLANIIAMDILD